ncbi:MAG: hypothetical protein DPW09_29730 [Anaerolineae bacterium]|nr:hypothetical protein [Anaerolineales bacterium]MCQ3977628.1 hypothetical protein [Anaerolineae bacterium]
MLIEKYDLEVFTPPCEPGAERYAAIARLTADISDVLPYLNATLRDAVYHQAANALTWKKGGHNIALIEVKFEDLPLVTQPMVAIILRAYPKTRRLASLCKPRTHRDASSTEVFG